VSCSDFLRAYRASLRSVPNQANANATNAEDESRRTRWCFCVATYYNNLSCTRVRRDFSPYKLVTQRTTADFWKRLIQQRRLVISFVVSLLRQLYLTRNERSGKRDAVLHLHIQDVCRLPVLDCKETWNVRHAASLIVLFQ
jgi:hypothetical protein